MIFREELEPKHQSINQCEHNCLTDNAPDPLGVCLTYHIDKQSDQHSSAWHSIVHDW